MKSLCNPIFILGFVLLSLLLNSRLATSQEVEDETEFNYSVGSGKGPDQWGELHEEWEACKHGDLQSPVDLLNKRVKVQRNLGRLKRGYKPANATLKNRGHDIMLQWVGGVGSITVNGTDYVLQQCHWHSPSEHTIDGKRFDMEMHLVHVSTDPSIAESIAVIGILYKIGESDPFLAELEVLMRSIADSHKEVNAGMIDPRHIKMGSRRYYRYMGSLTVPPCTEGVIWTLSKKVRNVSEDQLKLLKHAVHDFAERNSRPLQPINDRPIHLYESPIAV